MSLENPPLNSPTNGNETEHFLPTPPSPDATDGSEVKGSRKREREVSLEPATPRDAEDIPAVDAKDRRPPATKKNRTALDSTAEEPETPPPSPKMQGLMMVTSPPHETKVRQIRERVRGLTWDENAPPISQTSSQESLAIVDNQTTEDPPTNGIVSVANPPPSPKETLEPPVEMVVEGVVKDAKGSPIHPSESDSDDQEKNLKRKLRDKSPESTKRARDDSEPDDNPREKKRPTPPPDEQPMAEPNESALPETQPVEVDDPTPPPKLNAFMSYASTASPFSKAKGPSVFGNTLASPFTSAVSKSTTASFNSIPGPSKDTQSAAGTKRSGFEAFSSQASTFGAPSRAKSPTGFSSRSNSANSAFTRSKSPPRTRALGNALSAFSAYSGSSSPFSTPPVKKQRQDHDSGSDQGNDEKDNGITQTPTVVDGSDDEGDCQTSFSERLRAGKGEEDQNATSEEPEDRTVPEVQDVPTGEEDDDTRFQVRGKLYRLSDQNQWQERGTGLLKLKVRKADGKRPRLVMRKEAVYTLLLNTPLFRGMKCALAQDPRFVRFSSIENGASVHYNLRVANAKVAAELQDEINASIPVD